MPTLELKPTHKVVTAYYDNRGALEWLIDQYRVTRDDNGDLTNDPNRLDDEQYIVRLLGQVITVSLETMKVVKGLPVLNETK
jgi:predicted helicase